MSESEASELHPMHFKLCYVTSVGDFGGQDFELQDPKSDIRLVLRPTDSKSAGYVAGDGFAEASCIRQVPARLATEARESGVLSVKKGLVGETDRALSEFTRRALLAIRWRQGYGGQADPIRIFKGFFWSTDGSNWKLVADTLHAEFGALIFSLKWSDDLVTAIKQTIQDEKVEPLGHELLYEARALEFNSIRSAIVLAVTAAEVGFKQFAVDLVPGSKWLVENLPTPPLVRMLREFLPTLPIRRKLVDQQHLVPESLLAELEKAVQLRNDVVHGGKGNLKRSTVRSAVKAVRDLLYLLDVYAGDEWAHMNLSVETFTALTAPASHG